MLNGQKRLSPKKLLTGLLTAFLSLLTVGAAVVPHTTERNSATAVPPVQTNLPWQTCWTFPNENLEGSMVASDNEIVVLPFRDGRLIALDSRTGLPIWSIDLGGRIKSIPDLLGNGIFIVSAVGTGEKNPGRHIIRCLSRQTGIVIWQEEMPAAKTESDARFYLYRFRRELFIAVSGGDFFSFDAFDGHLTGTKNFRSALSAVPFFKDGRAVLGLSDKRILTLSLDESEGIVELKTRAVPTAVLTAGDNLVWGSFRGEVFSAGNAPNKNKDVWRLRTGGEILTVASDGAALLAASLDNYIYSVSVQSGKIIWKKRLSGRPASLNLADGGSAVLVSVGDPSAIIAETKSGRTINKISFGENIFLDGSPQFSSTFIIFPTSAGLFAVTFGGTCQPTNSIQKK